MQRLAWIVAGALVIGTLDAAYAIIFWGMRGVAPIRIFQSIAAGLISLGIVVVYWLVSRFLTVLTKRPILWTSRSPFLLSWVVCSVIVHAFLIGVPAARFARKAEA